MKPILLLNLLFMLLPLLFIGFFYTKWVGNVLEIPKATMRMIAQLLAIGYVLVYIFNSKSSWIGFFIVLFMVAISSWIALRNIENKSFEEYKKIFFSILVGGSINLFIVIFLVLDIKEYDPRFLIPLAGMIYANAMNAVSLASDRFEAEIKRSNYQKARGVSLKTSLIPQINAFLAVGLVSLPGMMTGQILSGVDPLIATRYQIMVMAMVLGSTGMSVVLYLTLKKSRSKGA